jgi:hypothetical protein
MIMNENASSGLMDNWMSSGGAVMAPGADQAAAQCDFDIRQAAETHTAGCWTFVDSDADTNLSSAAHSGGVPTTCPYEPELDAVVSAASRSYSTLCDAETYDAGMQASAASASTPAACY